MKKLTHCRQILNKSLLFFQTDSNTGNIFIKEGFKVVFGLKCFPRYCILSDHSKCNLYTVTGETLKIEQEQQTMKELPNESTLLGK